MAWVGLAWVGQGLAWMLSVDEYESWLVPVYVVEATILAALALLALLVQFRVGAPWLKLMWFCLGMSSVLVALGTLYIGPPALPGLVLGGAAGLLAALRTRAHLIGLIGWFAAGVIAQVVLMAVLLFIGLMTLPYGRPAHWP